MTSTIVSALLPVVVTLLLGFTAGWHHVDLELGHHRAVDFGNADFVNHAECFGAKGYRIGKSAELLPALRELLASDGVSVIACPVDYRENLKLTTKLGELTNPL